MPMGHNRSAILSCDTSAANFLSDALFQAGYDRPQRSETLGVAKLGTYAPRLLVVDFDHIRSDKLESIRQIRFVLPDCAIVVMSSNLKRTWARQCHMAGANGVFSSTSSITKLATGLRNADRSGCYTDPAFAVPSSEN
jgi:DNA-binding NarL/FixJ family response regulator